MISSLLTVFYIAPLILLIVIPLRYLLFLIILIILKQNKNETIPETPCDWPTICIQCPTYNEKFVIERLIDALASLDYPTNKLTIQFLDESSDETTEIINKKIIDLTRRGVNAYIIHLQNERGSKAKLLEHGFKLSSSQFFCVLDADFFPPPLFLKELVPCMLSNNNIGMVQARVEFLNYNYNALTFSQAIFFDIFFLIEAPARNALGLSIYSLGSAVLWRRDCILNAGGWQFETISAEDLDISYRAQDKGWKLMYAPFAKAYAELPVSISDLKRQQFKWVYSSAQILRKFKLSLLKSKIPIAKRLDTYFYLATYFYAPIIIILFLLPIISNTEILRLPSATPLLIFAFSLMMFVCIVSPYFDLRYKNYANWRKRLLFSPLVIFSILGMSLNNSIAIFYGFFSIETNNFRTPKSYPKNVNSDSSKYSYCHKWAELIAFVYLLGVIAYIANLQPIFVPILLMFLISFGCISFLEFVV